MIAKVAFRPAEFKPGTDTGDARNVTEEMYLHLTLDRRGLGDLIRALASCVDGAGAASIPSHHGTIWIEMLPEDSSTSGVVNARRDRR